MERLTTQLWDFRKEFDLPRSLKEGLAFQDLRKGRRGMRPLQPAISQPRRYPTGRGMRCHIIESRHQSQGKYSYNSGETRLGVDTSLACYILNTTQR